MGVASARGGERRFVNIAQQAVLMVPIGIVRSPRTERRDDFWGNVESTIELDAAQYGAESLEGLDQFSHLEVVFLLDRIDAREIETAARHPRNRTDWPKVGIFAQRGAKRPNRIGVSRCTILAVEGRSVRVRGLDAIDGTPVLDIKPYMREFGPAGDVRQPRWADEIMSEYYA